MEATDSTIFTAGSVSLPAKQPTRFSATPPVPTLTLSALVMLLVSAISSTQGRELTQALVDLVVRHLGTL